MPSLNEKVILTIKLELGEILKDLKRSRMKLKRFKGKERREREKN
jgi:hypothetical protein